MNNRLIWGAALPLFLMTLLVLAFAGAASAQTPLDNNAGARDKALTDSDKQFVKKAAQGGLAEVQLGELATQKAASPEVRQFGQRMVDDHTAANNQLKQVAMQKGIDIPDSLSAKDEATKARLSKLSGEAFDRAYVKDMVTDHTKDISDFRMEAQNGSDPDVKNFASQTLPTLQDHLKQVKGIAPKTAKQSSQSAGTQ